MDLAHAIKSSLSIIEVMEYYGFNANRHNKITCPFHLDRTASLKIFSDTNSFYCFGCGQGGTVIDFVQKYFDLDFKKAIEKLDSDFNLNLGINNQLTAQEKQQLNDKIKQRKAEQERKNAAIKAEKDLYNTLWDEWIRLDKNKMQYAPKSMDNELHPLYIEALQKIGYQEYLIDCLT